MKYIYTQTHRTTACSYLTPQARMTFTKLTAFSDLEKVSIWVCVMELQTFITYCTHKLPFAVKIQIPITLRLRRRACKARERLNYSSLGLGQGDAHDHHQNHPNKYLPMFLSLPGIWLSCVFPVLWFPHNTQIPLSPFSTFSLSHNPIQKYQMLFSLFQFPRRFSLPGLFPHYRLPFPCWSATVSLPPSWSKLPEPSANHKTQNSPMREIGLRTGVHTHVLVHCHNWNILSSGLKMWYRNVSNWC